MKRYWAYLIGICIVAFLTIIIFLGHFIDPFDSRKQMEAAKKYMNSLTDKDIQVWIQRTQHYLKNPPTNFGLGPLPPELQQLGMTGIEENSNYVDYMWLGGMDYTALEVVRMDDGDFQVFAIYTPYTNRMIWPKR